MKYLFFIVFLCCFDAFGVTKEDIFIKVYNSNLIDGRKCGQNSLYLVKEWKKHGFDISNTEIWSIRNDGINYFGLIKHYQSRWASLVVRSSNENGEAYRTNDSGGWYFHVFVVDDGKVYDASFYDSPRVLALNDYINDMYILRHDIGVMNWEKRQVSLKMVSQYSVNAIDASKAIFENVPNDKVACGNLLDILDRGIQQCL